MAEATATEAATTDAFEQMRIAAADARVWRGFSFNPPIDRVLGEWGPGFESKCVVIENIQRFLGRSTSRHGIGRDYAFAGATICEDLAVVSVNEVKDPSNYITIYGVYQPNNWRHRAGVRVAAALGVIRRNNDAGVATVLCLEGASTSRAMFPGQNEMSRFLSVTGTGVTAQLPAVRGESMAVALDEEVQLHLALRDEVGRSFVSSRDLFDTAANGGKGFSTVVRSKTDGVRAMSTERLALPSLEVDVFMRHETTLDEPTLVVLGAFHLADLSRDDVWCGSMLNIWSRVSNLDVHRAVDREQWLLARFQRDRRTEIMSVFLSAVLHFGGWLYISYLDGELKRLLRRNLFPFIGPLPQIPAVVLRDGGAAGRWIREVGLECLQKDVVLAMLSYIAQHNSSRRAATAGAPRVWNGIMARGRLPLASREEIARQLTLRYDYPRRVASTFARRAHESELSRRRRWPAPWEEAAVAADAARRLAQQLTQAPAPAPAVSRRARRARRPAARGPRQATLRDYLIASSGVVRPRMPRGRTVAAAPAPSATEALEAQRRELAAHNERQIARDEAYARRIYEAEASAAVAPNAPAPARDHSPPRRTRPRPAATPTPPRRQRSRTGDGADP